jgi:hypothetical protein
MTTPPTGADNIVVKCDATQGFQSGRFGLGADRDCRTPPPQRPAVALDAGTNASTLVERLTADLHGLDHDLSSKNAGELAYRAATACEALALALNEAEASG